MNLSDTDQALYSAPTPQTATVSDEAVHGMPERIWTCNETRNIWIGEKQDDTTEYVRADIAAAPCSVEVKKLRWVQQDGKLAWDSSEYRIYVLLGSKPAVYRLLKASFGTQYAGDFVGVNALEAAMAAAQADFDRRTLSQIVTKPVDDLAVTPADAVFGIMAWLSGRNEVVALSARHGAAIAAELASEFCKENDLHNFSQNYPDNLKYPTNTLSQPVDVAAVRDGAEEFAIDKLRFRAFHTNSDADRQAYFNAVNKWFQDRHLRAISPAEPVDQWQDMVALSELSKLTYAIQHNPNCPDRYLVRLPGKAGIDLKPYGNVAFRTPNQTNDILGFGKTLHEAYIAATAAPTSKGGE